MCTERNSCVTCTDSRRYWIPRQGRTVLLDNGRQVVLRNYVFCGVEYRTQLTVGDIEKEKATKSMYVQ